MRRYCAHGPLELMALAWPKLHGSAKLALRPGLLGLAARARSRGARSPWRAGDGGHRFRSLAARGGGKTGRGSPRRSGARFEGWGRRGAHRSSALHGGAVGGGGSPVRGRWSGRGRSLCGRRGAPGRGDACGGGDEAGGGPERPAHGGVPSGEEEGSLSGGGD
jgi:hypothetical protein